jgi:tRNA-dihydrouridine synthase 2
MGVNLFSRIHGDFTRRLLVSLRPIRKMLDLESEERPIKRAKMEATKESSPLVLDGAELAIKTDAEMALPVEFSKSYTPPLDYRNKLVLAPMVRSGTCEYRN